ncbi:hypothetical protein I7I51_06756 [Histoplasma capsulatum]|uniref:Uncharacterized protein n=1 Tax=Ajellomyces capsulatus TaxID=5037 RepID=A0A8A1MJ49_AJECA|nr:hypothetical protein I7I51_06756 [Histoplasma capsulatum]
MFHRAPHISLPTGIPYLATTPSAETRSSRARGKFTHCGSIYGTGNPYYRVDGCGRMVLCDRDVVTDFWANDRREAAHKSSADQTHAKVLGYMEIDLYICIRGLETQRSPPSPPSEAAEKVFFSHPGNKNEVLLTLARNH